MTSIYLRRRHPGIELAIVLGLLSLGCPGPHQEGPAQLPPCDSTFKALWDEPISVSESNYVVTANILLIGPASSLDSLTELEVARLQLETERILRHHTLTLFPLTDDRDRRQETIVSPLNAALGRRVVSDVYFLSLGVGEIRPSVAPPEDPGGE